MTEPTPTLMGAPAIRANRLLARSINIGLSLGDPAEPGWAIPIAESDLDRCAEAGFTAIRLVVSLARHSSPTDSFRVEAVALDRINEVVHAARVCGLAVLVANMGDSDLMNNPLRHRARVFRAVGQLTESLRRYGPDVILEPLAEPHGALDPLWNDYLADLCKTVRGLDPHRTLVVGPRSYNNARYLSALTLPENEQNLIVTVHQYWPITFTMQGETWLGGTDFGDPADWVGTTWDGTDRQRAELEAGFDAVAHFADSHQRPIFIGEFGTTNNADMSSRVRWTRVNRELAEQHHFSWSCWSYAPTFAVYDQEHDSWHQDLLQALVPSGARRIRSAEPVRSAREPRPAARTDEDSHG